MCVCGGRVCTCVHVEVRPPFPNLPHADLPVSPQLLLLLPLSPSPVFPCPHPARHFSAVFSLGKTPRCCGAPLGYYGALHPPPPLMFHIRTASPPRELMHVNEFGSGYVCVCVCVSGWRGWVWARTVDTGLCMSVLDLPWPVSALMGRLNGSRRFDAFFFVLIRQRSPPHSAVEFRTGWLPRSFTQSWLPSLPPPSPLPPPFPERSERCKDEKGTAS